MGGHKNESLLVDEGTDQWVLEAFSMSLWLRQKPLVTQVFCARKETPGVRGYGGVEVKGQGVGSQVRMELGGFISSFFSSLSKS